MPTRPADNDTGVAEIAALPSAIAPPPSRKPTDESGRFNELSRQIKHDGLLDDCTGWYVRKVLINLGLLAGGLVALLLLGDSWWQLLVACWFGIVAVQFAFMFHESGHNAMFRSKAAAALVGYVSANLVNGVSFGWWVGHHSRHHSHPNHLTLDPDIGRRTAIFDIKQYDTRSRRGRFIVRHQHVLFFVLLTLESYKMQKNAVKQILGRKVRRPLLEGVLIVAHVAIYLAVVFLVLPPVLGVAFIVVQQAVAGLYFGLLFAPNHKGMVVRDDERERLDWLERQVLTSRNISPSPVIDWLYGGLNYQIEHHLYPAMPQPHLAAARRLTMAYCADKGISYHEVGIVASYREVAHFLHEVSAPTRRRRAA